jgi:hypothetical protein
MIPNASLDYRPSQLYITVESTQDLNNAVLEVHGSANFAVSPPSIALPSVSRSTIEVVQLTRLNPKLLAGDQAITVTLYQQVDQTSRKVLASKLLKFSYTPEISLRSFFFFAMIGALVGYWLRVVVKVLGSVAPPPAQPDAVVSQQGPITRLVNNHYYLVDCLVTLILAFILLATLIQGGRPPQSCSMWYGALASGVGIGLFTNSELLTRLRR